MPNNITNIITFGADDTVIAAFQQMLADLCVDGEPLGSIDFNKLVPMPESLDIEDGSRTTKGLEAYQDFVDGYLQGKNRSEVDLLDIPQNLESAFLKRRKDIRPDCWELGRTAFQNIQKYGFPTWYDWSLKHWGTKWNAYQCVPLRAGDHTMSFQTAWNGVPELIKQLSKKYPEQTVTYRWADENIGYHVGEEIFKNGTVIGSRIPQNASREAYEMAAEIMGVDLASYNLYLSKDENSYEYHEQPPRKSNKIGKNKETAR